MIDYLKQPSTWRGIITLAGLFGVHIAPDQTNDIIQACLVAVALIEIIRNEAKK